MQRYFANIFEGKVILDDGDIHHLLNVMRAKPGQKIEIVSDSKAYIYEIKSINPLSFSKVEENSDNPELLTPITLFFGLAKGDKIDFVIQKATELGVSRIVLFNSKRCVVKYEAKDINKKLERFNKIAKEAAEQSHRNKIPEILGVINLDNIPNNYFSEDNYVAYEKLLNSPDLFSSEKVKKAKSISLFIGPEGGFDEEEILCLENKGVKAISLGKRILRTETAAVYGLSVLSYILER